MCAHKYMYQYVCFGFIHTYMYATQNIPSFYMEKLKSRRRSKGSSRTASFRVICVWMMLLVLCHCLWCCCYCCCSCFNAFLLCVFFLSMVSFGEKYIQNVAYACMHAYTRCNCIGIGDKHSNWKTKTFPNIWFLEICAKTKNGAKW